VQDKSKPRMGGPWQALPEAGVALTILAAGAAVLVLMLAGVWIAPGAVPAAFGTSLLVFGGYLAAQSIGRPGVARAGAAAAIRHFDSLADPVFLTDLQGRALARNPAAAAAAGPDGFLDPWCDDAGASRYRLLREALANGVAAEPLPGAAGGQIVVTRMAERLLHWRVEGQPLLPAAPDMAAVSLPWLRIDAEGLVLRANPAAAALAPERLDRIDDVLVDMPLRPAGVHVLTGSGQAVRAVVLAEAEGVRDLLLLPLNSAEISGLVPDHFLDDLPVALARLETSGKLTYANRAARQLIGERAAPGVNIADLIEGLGRSIAERLQDTLKGRALGRSEIARGRSEDSEIFLQVAFTRTILDGAPSLLAVLSDATELKTLEAQFVQSQKMQAVGQLAGGVAHDFNNLLTAINGHCDLLLMRHDVADVEHGDLMQIRQNANRAAALVRQLLAFSRKQTLRPKVISLQDTLSELAHLLNRLLTDKVALKIEHGPDLWPVRVDERQLEQVIMNLVVNARDAMPRGGEVRITTRNVRLTQDLHRDRAVVLPGDYVLIEVADSGTGIPEAKLNKIFEPFYTTKPVGEGTGLGLSTAYGIIKQTGGFIFADSPPGRRHFHHLSARLRAQPARPGAGARGPQAPRPHRPRPGDAGRGRGGGALLRRPGAAPARLYRGGGRVRRGGAGNPARRQPAWIDMMLSDVIMPGLDGPAWVREARKARPDVKVIFMSGYAEDAFAGGDSGIPKAVFLPKAVLAPRTDPEGQGPCSTHEVPVRAARGTA
jgi:two-component system, cell cycle sensor histidine kinase and response regulator CckA